MQGLDSESDQPLAASGSRSPLRAETRGARSLRTGCDNQVAKGEVKSWQHSSVGLL